MSKLKGQVHLRDWVKTWPTPRAGNPGSRPNGKGGKVLAEEVEIAAGLRQRGQRIWPTPTVCGNYNKAGLSPKSGDGLATAVLKWPTPIASDSRGSSGRPAPGKQTQLVDAVRFATPLARDHKSGKFSQDGKAHRESQTRGKPLSEQIGGSLNPTWVEWLMGWPLGWTDLKPLETGRFPSAPQPPGSS